MLHSEIYIKPQFYNVTAIRTKEQRDFLDFLFNGPMKDMFKKVFEHYPKYLELVEYLEYFGIGDRPVVSFLQMEEEMGLFFMKLATMEDEKAKRFPFFVTLYEELKNKKDYYSADVELQHERLAELDVNLESVMETYVGIGAIEHVLPIDDSFVAAAKKRIEATGCVDLEENRKVIYAHDIKFLPFILMDWAVVEFCKLAPAMIEEYESEKAAELKTLEEAEAKAKQEAEEQRKADQATFMEKLEDLADRIKKDLALGEQGDIQHFVKHWERTHGYEVVDYIIVANNDGIRYVREVVLDRGDGQRMEYALAVPSYVWKSSKANYLPDELRNVPITTDARYLQKQYLEKSRVFEDDVDYRAWRNEQLAERDKPVKTVEDLVNEHVVEAAKELDKQTFAMLNDASDEKESPGDIEGATYQDDAPIDVIENVEPIVQVGDTLVTEPMHDQLEWLAAADAYLKSVGRAFQVLKLEFPDASHHFFTRQQNDVISKCIEDDLPAELVYVHFRDLQRRMEAYRVWKSINHDLRVKACTELLRFFDLIEPLKENISSSKFGLKMSAVQPSNSFVMVRAEIAEEMNISVFDLERQLRSMQREVFVKQREEEQKRRKEGKELRVNIVQQADELLDLLHVLFPEAPVSFFDKTKEKVKYQRQQVENMTNEQMTSVLTFGNAILLIGQDEGSRKMLNKKQIAREILGEDVEELFQLVKEEKRKNKFK